MEGERKKVSQTAENVITDLFNIFLCYFKALFFGLDDFLGVAFIFFLIMASVKKTAAKKAQPRRPTKTLVQL